MQPDPDVEPPTEQQVKKRKVRAGWEKDSATAQRPSFWVVAHESGRRGRDREKLSWRRHGLTRVDNEVGAVG